MKDSDDIALATDAKPVSKLDVRGFLTSNLGRAARRYLLVGGASAAADWGLFALFLYGFDLHYLASGAISFILATGINYYLSVRFVFGSGSRGTGNAVFLVYAASAIGLVINLGVLTIGIDFLDFHPLVAKFFATGVAVFWNFCIRYFYIFK